MGKLLECFEVALVTILFWPIYIIFAFVHFLYQIFVSYPIDMVGSAVGKDEESRVNN